MKSSNSPLMTESRNAVDARQKSSAADKTLLAVRRRLDQSHYPAIQSIQCSGDDRAVVLRGVVNSFYQRQLALALARSGSGSKPLVDCLEVSYPRTEKADGAHAGALVFRRVATRRPHA